MTQTSAGSPPGGGAAAPRIVVRNLTKRYGGGVVALDDVSLDVGVGEKLVLLGPSGCGKTTLLRCVAGLEEPDTGEIEIDGRIVYSSGRGILVPPEKRGLSMVFQSYALWPHMTVFDNVAYPLQNTGVPRAEIASRVAEVLRIVGCEPYAQRYPSQLSGGQQQRISLARAIVGRDSSVLFDEPLSNVDAQVREQLRGELVALQRRFGFSALYVTHDQSEALALAHRIAVMRAGRVAQIGTARDIYDRPASRYVADFTGAANAFPGRVQSVAAGQATVDTGPGRFVVPAVAAGGQPLAAGQAVDVVIRPEHLRLLDGPADRNAFAAAIGTAMFLGVYSEYSLTAGDGTPLMLRTTQAGMLSEGQSVWLGADPAHVVVFAAASADG